MGGISRYVLFPLLGCWVLATSVAAIAADAVTAHCGKEYDDDARIVEAAMRAPEKDMLNFDFHRDQAFRGSTAGKSWRVLSVGWWRGDNGGKTRCALVVLQEHSVKRVDVLRDQNATMPWSCEGEPALRITDLDGDSCPEIIALYPIRPPSGDVFDAPIVLRCDAKTVSWTLDETRTQRLENARSLKTLRQAERLLSARR